ncbi:serine dehydratase beta chain, partial [Novosphingobium rosa]|uniref:serine dehydratase beta chain n=1 Tax=Novosphingobium rosa TaxID=76978 RepID=UPI00157C3788
MLGVRDLFRVGIGPSSSHTVGPMKAGHSFAGALKGLSFSKVQCDLLGSLAWTGAGHVTDKAVVLGLAGFLPDTIEPEQIDTVVEAARETRRLRIAGREITFDPDADIYFDRGGDTPVHPNTLRFRALDDEGGEVLAQRWCSIGGGFIVPEDRVGDAALEDEAQPPFPFSTGAELLEICDKNGLTIPEVMRANEYARISPAELDDYLDRVIAVMMTCIDRGMSTDGILPGRLKVPRRAMKLRQKLDGDRFRNRQAPHNIMDHISLFAIAVNEENAAGGKIVTAPTNGAAG